MNTSIFQELKYDSLRDIVLSPRGELDIKTYQNGGKYVNYKGQKVSLGNIPVKKEVDPVFDYVFNGGFEIKRDYEMEKEISNILKNVQ